MSLNILRHCVAAAALLTASAAIAQQAQPAPSGAGAQPAAPPAPVVQEFVGVEPEWNKVCVNDPQTQKQLCQTSRLFGDRAENPVLSISVADPSGADKAIQILAPMGVALRPGFRLSVDKGAPEGGGYDLCTPQGALGGLRVKQAFINSMKKGEKLAVSFKTINGAEFIFNLPLAGFGKAFDGPGIDPKVAEERSRKLQEELMKKAEEERKKLEAQKGGAAAPAKPK